MSDLMFESPRVRHCTNGTDLAIMIREDTSPMEVVLPFDDGRNHLLEACQVYLALEQFIERETRMTVAEFFDGMKRLLAPADQ